MSDKDTSGTPGYMGKQRLIAAPEVMCKQAHGYPVDYFALGVIGYEFMLGRVPSLLILEALLGKQPELNSRGDPLKADTNQKD